MRETHRLPSYSFGGHEVYDKVPEFTAPYGNKVAIIGGVTALSVAMPILRPVLDKEGIEILAEIPGGGECSYERAREIASMDEVKQADFMFAVGGGKVMDLVKVVAIELEDKPFFTFPTIAATCAASSEAAAVYTPDHVFFGMAFVKHPPLHNFINAQILVEAPERYLWAGMGDTIAKRYEIEFSSRNREKTYNSQLGLMVAPMCAEPILKYAVQAIADNKAKKRSLAFDEMVMSVVFTTAIVSGSLREDYNSNVAHATCYGCATNPETEHKHLHGELVSYGVLVLLLVDQQMDEFNRWYPVYKEIGWPRKLEHLHLTKDYIPNIIDKALSVNDVVVSPYEITRDMMEQAMLKLESM